MLGWLNFFISSASSMNFFTTSWSELERVFTATGILSVKPAIPCKHAKGKHKWATCDLCRNSAPIIMSTGLSWLHMWEPRNIHLYLCFHQQHFSKLSFAQFTQVDQISPRVLPILFRRNFITDLINLELFCYEHLDVSFASFTMAGWSAWICMCIKCLVSAELCTKTICMCIHMWYSANSTVDLHYW